MKTERVDVCVIGSGAGGAVLAWEAARRGLSTLVVEKGPRFRTRDMGTDEIEMIPRLYKDGGMQMSTSLDFFILQGSCVGGSTAVSNMVLIRAPADRLELWRRFGASIDSDTLNDGYSKLESLLHAAHPAASARSKSTQLFENGAQRIGLTPRPMLKALGDCQACGNCNIGCSFGTKQSANNTFIPWAEDLGARVLAETTVAVLHRSRGTIRWAEAITADGTKLRIEARVFIVAGGPIGSSALLLASGIEKNVGTRVSFNAGAMIVAEYEEELDAYDADQMTTYVEIENGLIEPTHNPLMSQALTTPGWMDDHAALMQRAGRLAYAGAMYATEPTGKVVMSPWFGHEETRFRLTPRDLAGLRKGLRTIGEIFFAAGAKRVFLPTEQLNAVESSSDLGRIDTAMQSLKDFQSGSSHPQGGNPMSDDPARGVIDSNFAIHGLDNAFVCDASVFPDALGVNPMHTVMSLALAAAPKVMARA